MVVSTEMQDPPDMIHGGDRPDSAISLETGGMNSSPKSPSSGAAIIAVETASDAASGDAKVMIDAADAVAEVPAGGAGESQPGLMGNDAESETSTEPPFGDICPVEGVSHWVLEQFSVPKCPACKKLLREECTFKGLNHSGLRRFKIKQCPHCKKSLFTPDLFDDEQSGDEKRNDRLVDSLAEEGKGPALEGQQRRGPRHVGTEELIRHFSQRVEYLDASCKVITGEEWKRPFDLQYERTLMRRAQGLSDAGSKRRKPTFELVTVVLTSIPRDRYRRGYEEQQEILREGVVHNPNIAVAVRSVRLVARSMALLGAVKAVLTYNPVPPLPFEKLELPEPYALVAHHLEELEEYRRNLQGHPGDVGEIAGSLAADAELVMDLDILLQFVKSTVGGLMEKERALHKRPEGPVCTFRMLWLLFKPGSIVYARNDKNTMDAYVVKDVEMGDGILSAPTDSLAPCTVHLWYLDYDWKTRRVSRAWHSVKISPFVGERTIDTSFEVVPANMWDEMDNKALRDKLVADGERWFSLLSGQYMSYNGSFAEGDDTPFNGRVYIDPAAQYEMAESWSRRKKPRTRTRRSSSPSSSSSSSSSDSSDDEQPAARRGRPVFVPNDVWAAFDEFDPENLKPKDDLSPDISTWRKLLVSKKIAGFVFKTRRWELLHVASCEKVLPNRGPFDNLVMDLERKTMIESLVAQYTNRTKKVWGADHIQHKGEGQIFLLHGGPGVGKTFTAECIAEYLAMPMLALTCGDLGTAEVDMERNLNKWCRLGHKWNAVMLIDEADVFLEKRSNNDLSRNSLVSVFLREIEYYRGILFLTTNRVGRFDDAFVSRIQIVIHYENLSTDQRRQIWEQFFRKLESEKGRDIRVEESARDFVANSKMMAGRKAKWNGREIRNAFQTAVALAEYSFANKPAHEKQPGEKAVLTRRDFERVCLMTSQFKTYLKKLHNTDEDGRAADETLRAGEESEEVEEEADSESQDEESDDSEVERERLRKEKAKKKKKASRRS